jgi:hypothetical protein
VQEVEEVREAHKAAASAQMAGIAEMAQSTEIGTPRKKEQRVDALASKKTYTCSQVRTKYGWIPHNAGFGFLDLTPATLGQIHF